MKKASDYLKSLKEKNETLQCVLNNIYSDKELVEERCDSYITLVEKFIERFGDSEIFLSRSPGRVNIMGRHIDHRGGFVNAAAVSRETVAAISPRDDDIVRVTNVDEKFEDFEFSISEIISLSDETHWLGFIESEKVEQLILRYKGHWGNYIKSAVLRVQFEYPEKKIRGMDIAIYGNIPSAAGLSSSSSLVVAIMEAVVKINCLDIDSDEFVRLCGEGEWFVGSRGGAGDHAAMKYGKTGCITKIGFCPVRKEKSVSFSNDYRIIVANSFISANKSAGAKSTFNQKVASYSFGVMYIKKNFPEQRDKIIHLRDINCGNLGVDENDILRMVMTVPERVSPQQLIRDLPEYKNEILHIQNTHELPECYEVRSILLFGITECERAKICSKHLENNDYEALGKLMKISHNGDRVYSGEEKYDYSYPDSTMESLISKNKRLYEIPGGYGCSVKEIDKIVDEVCEIDGVAGAEISGAGLGGCMIILCTSSATDKVLERINENYYHKNGYENGAYVYIPIEGSGIVEV